jgi:hypothetical protein
MEFATAKLQHCAGCAVGSSEWLGLMMMMMVVVVVAAMVILML